MYIYYLCRKSEDASDQEEHDDDNDDDGTKAKVPQTAREFSSKIDEPLASRSFPLLCRVCQSSPFFPVQALLTTVKILKKKEIMQRSTLERFVFEKSLKQCKMQSKYTGQQVLIFLPVSIHCIHFLLCTLDSHEATHFTSNAQCNK